MYYYIQCYLQKHHWIGVIRLWLILCLMTAGGLTGCGSGGASSSACPLNKPYGLCFGPYVDGSSPDEGAVATVEQVDRLLRLMRPYTDRVRLFTCAPLRGSTESMASVAKRHGFHVAAGCWLSRNAQANRREVDWLMEEIRRGNVDLAVVGNEVLHRGDLTQTQLMDWLREVKKAGRPVTTNETYDQLLGAPAIAAECDVFMVSIYPFWMGVSIDEAFQAFVDAYRQVQNRYAGKSVVVGETGWPSAGNAVGQARPSAANALSFLHRILGWSNRNQYGCYYFEAFDEPWKAAAEGPQGAHWGIWTSEGAMKPGVLDVFRTQPEEPVKEPVLPTISVQDLSLEEGHSRQGLRVSVPVNTNRKSAIPVSVRYRTEAETATANSDFIPQSGVVAIQPGQTQAPIDILVVGDLIRETDEHFRVVLFDPQGCTITRSVAIVRVLNDDRDRQLEITHCPRIGETSTLTGRCYGVDPDACRICVYICVRGGWWLKPFWEHPLTPITEDGRWECDIVTGGVDEQATAVAVLLLPSGYTPPLVGNVPELPAEAWDRAVERVLIDRTTL